MLFGSDRSSALASDFGPRSFREDGPRQPTEIESQVVKSPRVMSNTVSVCMNHGEQIFTGCLHEWFIANWIVRFAAKSASASLLRRWDSVRRHFIHHSLPSSLCHFWIVGRKVSTSKIEVERRLPVRFIHRVKHAFSLALVRCAKGLLLV